MVQFREITCFNDVWSANTQDSYCMKDAQPTQSPTFSPNLNCSEICQEQVNGIVQLGCCQSDFCICFDGEGIDGCCDWCLGTSVFWGGGCVDNVTCHNNDECYESSRQSSSQQKKQPRISASTIENGIQESYGFISIFLSHAPGIFLAIVAIKHVIQNNLGTHGFRHALYFIIFPFPLLKSCASIKDIQWLYGFRHAASKLFPEESIKLLQRKQHTEDWEENKLEETQHHETFYFLISNLCFASVIQLGFQCYILVQFPTRSTNFSQIMSTCYSFLFTAFSASQNLGFDENKIEMTFLKTCKQSMANFAYFSPLVISSLLFNIGSTIIAAQSEVFFFLYLPIVLLSICVPA